MAFIKNAEDVSWFLKRLISKLDGRFLTPGLGAFAGQAVLIVALPIIARIYAPEALSQLAIYLAIAIPLSIVLTGRLEHALPRVAGDQKFGLFCRCVIVPVVIVFLAIIGLLAKVGFNEVFVIAFVGGSSAIFSVTSMFPITEKNFGTLAWLKFVNPGQTAGLQLAFGYLSPTVESLAIAYGIGSLGASALCIPAIRRCYLERGSTWVFDRETTVFAFISKVGTSALLSNCALSITSLLIGWMFPPVYLASYFLVRRLLIFPTQVVANSVRDVSYGITAQEQPEEIRKLAKPWLWKLRLSSVAVFALALLLIPVREYIFGDQYIMLAELLLLLGIVAGTQLLGTSMSSLLLALKAEHIRLRWNIERVIVLALLSIWAIATGPQFPFLIVILTGVQSLLYLRLYLLTLRLIRN